MPKFDYSAAKAAGHTDDEIAQFLEAERARGVDVWLDRNEVEGGSGLTAAQGAAQVLKETGVTDVVGAGMNFAGSLLSWPKAAVLGQIAEPGSKLPPFSPTASYDFFKAHPLPEWARSKGHLAPLTSPMALDILTDIPMAKGLNMAGGLAMRGASALSDIPIAGGKSIRQMPGVKQALEFNTPGASLPKQYRAGVQARLRTAEGEANLAGYQREQALGKFLEAPTEVKDKVQTAIELRQIGTLTPDEQAMAAALQAEYAARPASRAAAGLRRHELGAHLPGLEAKAEKARIRFEARPDRLNRVRLKLAEKRLLKATRGVPAEERVAFTDRPLTREARVESGLKPFGEATPGGLGTGRLGRRISHPGKTTAQINKELEAQGKTRIEPVVEGAFRAGEANDLRVMHGKIIKGLADDYGVPTKNPLESIAKKHESVSTGFVPEIQRELQGKKFPKEIDELVSRLNERMKPEQFEHLGRFNRAMGAEFKKWALFSPGFVSRNFQNNFFQTAIFGNMDPGTWKDAFKVRRAMSTGKHMDDLVSVGKGKTVTVREYIDSAFKRRVLGGGQVAQEIGKSGIPVIGKAQRGVRWGNQAQEDISRMSFDLFNQRKGLDPIKAADRVDQILFNYSHRLQHPAKAALRRSYVPFINWSSQIGPLVARSIVERPGSYGMVGSAFQRVREDQGYGTPEKIALLGPDVAEQGGIPYGKTKEGKVKVAIPQFQGGYSVNELIPNKPTPLSALDTIARNLYPQLSAPYAIATNRDPLSGKPLTRGGEDLPMTAPQGLKALWLIPGGKQWAEKHNIIVDKDGTVKAPARLALLLRSVPHTRLPSILADAVSPGKNSETRLRSYFVGVRTVERDPEEGKRIQAGIKRSEQREKQSTKRTWMRAKSK